ncbi:hypothetical protein HYW94_03605, partial [Candidatus Uhrbacteria bacterium]|nr:hypothetical protein [Candidatus Uhrbacteria bacterium]
METGNEKYITKKIGMPRMILALLGIMVVGMSTAWFGKNPKTEPSSQATQDTQKDFLSATQDQSEDTEKTTVLQKDESVSTVDSQPSQKEDVLEVSLIDSKIVLEEKKSEKNTNEQKKQAGDVKEQKPVQQSVTPPSEPVIVPTEKSVSQEEKPAAVEEQKPTQPVVIPSPRPVIQKKEFADGIYSASGLYISPAGGEEIHISLTLKDTMITG